MTDLQKHILKKLGKVNDMHIINLCVDGAQVRMNRPMVDQSRKEMAYKFYDELVTMHDRLCIRDEMSWIDKVKSFVMRS